MFLIIGENEEYQLAKLLEHAKNNILSTDDVLDILNKDLSRDMSAHYIVLPIEHHIIFTIEPAKAENKFQRHLSIRYFNGSRLTYPQFAQEIMNYLEFQTPLDKLNGKVYEENLENGGKIINIVEVIEDEN